MQERFSYLFEQHFTKKAGNAEIEELMRLIHSGNFDQQLEQLLDEHYAKFKPFESPFSLDRENNILAAVLKTRNKPKEAKLLVGRKIWARISIAASIAFCLGIGIYFYAANTYKKDQELAANKIGPGSNKARLVLGNGKVILLDTVKNGSEVFDDGVRITKTKDGKLVYHIPNQDNGKPGRINTIETPRGGQYQVRLPDGTEVWLNAATTLKYSSAFKERKREVVLNGEAYFEVAHLEKQPFIVHTENQDVEVLGTHFNINAYADEQIQVTTLLEGAVKASTKTRTLLLKPGEQAISARANFNKAEADIETVMAWKNGDFIFKDEDLASVMKKVERWYDVAVVFEGIDPKAIKLGGWVSREKNISAVIKIIEPIAGIHIKIEGRRITVMK